MEYWGRQPMILKWMVLNMFMETYIYYFSSLDFLCFRACMHPFAAILISCIYAPHQDMSFQKDGGYMFIQGRPTMIHCSIQSLSPSIHGDGWLVYIHLACMKSMNHNCIKEYVCWWILQIKCMQDKSLESQNYCFLFGAGNRVCPGKELGIVKISMFLHHLVTRYRYSSHDFICMLCIPCTSTEKLIWSCCCVDILM